MSFIYTRNKLVMDNREIRRKKYQNMISEAMKSPNYNTNYNKKEATKFIWRNAYSLLPLLDWNENPNNLSEGELVKENQILLHYIFYSIDSILFSMKDCENLIDDYGFDNMSLCRLKLKAKFGDYHHIFFGDSSFTSSEYPISLSNELIEKVLGEEKQSRINNFRNSIWT